MARNTHPLRRFVCTVGIVALLAGALPALAHCGKCPADAKAMAEALMSSKVTLATATSLAEATTKGVAVKAGVHKHDDAAFVEVYCMVEEKIMAVNVDCATGKPSEPVEVKDLETHAGAEGAAAEAPSDEAVQSDLDEIAKATKAGKLEDADSKLTKLEALKDLSGPMKDKIEAARKALDAAKAASDMKKKLPGQP